MVFKWATVTGISPLRIKLDGDTTAIPATPDSLIDPATLAVDDRVRTELSGNRLVVLGRSGGLGLVSGRNLIINGNGAVNQRGAASGTSLALNAYFLDRWQSVVASNAVTWTGDEQGRILTIPSGKAIATTLERRDVAAGSYVLSWTGTASGSAVNVGGPESSAASPVLVTLDGAANVFLRFTDGTLSNVKFERGSTPTPPDVRTYAESLALCQRYYWRLSSTGSALGIATGVVQTSTKTHHSVLPFPTTMRASATMTVAAVNRTRVHQPGIAIDTTTALTATVTVDAARITATFLSASFVSAGAALLEWFGTTGWLAFDAEL